MQRDVSLRVLPIALAVAMGVPFLAQSQVLNDEQSIRNVIQTFADVRNAHDGAAVANLYSEDGQWISPLGGRTVRGRAALADFWAGMPGQVRRTVESVERPSHGIAVVRVATELEQPATRGKEVFILVRNGSTWRICVHQTVN